MAKGKRSLQNSRAESLSTEDEEASKTNFRTGLNVNSRIHRACTTCRRMKMRCEGPVDGACNRCQRTEQECIFEAPVASSSKQTEVAQSNADARRIEAVEAQMAEMHACMRQILAATQANTAAATPIGLSQPTVSNLEQQAFPQPWRTMNAQSGRSQQPAQPLNVAQSSLVPLSTSEVPIFLPHAASSQYGAMDVTEGPQHRQAHPLHDVVSVRSSPPSMTQFSHREVSVTPMSVTTHSHGYSPGRNAFEKPGGTEKEKTFGLVEAGASQAAQPNATPSISVRPTKRLRLEDEELPDEGLGAPIEALRGLAEAAVRRGAVRSSTTRSDDRSNASNIRKWISGGDESPMRLHSNVASRFNSPGPEEEEDAAATISDDLISRGMVDEHEARRLWATFSRGCPRFVAACFVEVDEDAPQPDMHAASPSEIQDKEWQAFDATRRKSPFLLATILAIGAQVDFAIHTELYDACMKEAQSCAQQTLTMRASQLRVEDVMALNLLASYCDYGWLFSGQAIRVAQELRLQDSLQRLKSLAMQHPVLFASQPRPASADLKEARNEARKLAHETRVWFFTFLLEHQISYGAGRPAVLHRTSIRDSRQFLQLTRHFDRQYDARFVATVELMALREKHFDCLAPFSEALNDSMMNRVHALNDDLHAWLDHWQDDLRRSGHEENSFLMASLHLQCATAKLYLTSTCLRSERTESRRPSGTESPTGTRWDAASAIKKTLIMQSIRAALEALRVGVSSAEYMRLLTWAPHYTVVTMTFSAVYVLKAVRLYSAAKLFSSRKHQQSFFENAQALAMRLCAIAKAHRYGAVVLKLLLQCPEFTQSSAARKGVKESGSTGVPRTPHSGHAGVTGGVGASNSARILRTNHMQAFGGGGSDDLRTLDRFESFLGDPTAPTLESNITDPARLADYALDMDMFLPGDGSHYDPNVFPSVNFSHIADERFGTFDQLLRDLGLENGMPETMPASDV